MHRNDNSPPPRATDTDDGVIDLHAGDGRGEHARLSEALRACQLEVQRLRSAEERYRLLAESASDVIWTMNLVGEITYLSPSVETLRGFTVEEAMRQRIDEILTPASQAQVIDYFTRLHRAIAEGTPPPAYRGEMQYLRKDGSILWADVIAFPITDAAGQVVELLGVSRDLSAPKAEQARLEEARQQLKRMLDHIPTPVAVNALQGDKPLLLINRAFEEVFGYTAEDIPTVAHWAQLAYPDEALRGRAMRTWEDRLASAIGPLQAQEVRVTCRDGQVRDVLIRSSTVDDMMLTTLVDITERRRAEQQLREREERLRLIADSTVDNLWTMDLQGRFTYVSPSIHRLSGYRTDEFITLPLAKMLSRDSLARAQDYLAGLATPADGGTPPPPFRGELQMLRKDGTTIWVESTASPRLDDAGRVVELVGVTRDITERKRLDEELQAHRQHLEALVQARTAELSLAKEAAEAASRAKTQFLANVSHELRTPLHGILGFVELAQRSPASARQAEWLKKAQELSRKLRALIDDVLEVTRIQADRVELACRPLTLRRLFEPLRLLLEPQARHKGLALRLDLPDALADLPLRGDELRLGQVLGNLVGNALKFTDSGSVSVRADRLPPIDGDVCLRFEVRDTGIGIAAKDLPRVFRAFEQIDASTTRQHDGTGLGLFICRHLVQAMGGTLDVDSEPGVGSSFWFTVRLQPGEPGDRPEGSAPDVVQPPGPAMKAPGTDPGPAAPDADVGAWLAALVERLDQSDPDARSMVTDALPWLARSFGDEAARLATCLSSYDFDGALLVARALQARRQ